MGKTEWTPGEWRSFTDDKGFSYVIADVAPTGYIVATGGFDEESEANAHLIAAAPSLYEALKKAMLVIELPAPEWRESALEEGFAALARARGEQP